MITGFGVTIPALALPQGSVGGVVRDSVDLEPVAYARVTVFADGAEAREAVSDRYGAFEVAGVRSGSGRIEVAGLGYELWTLDYAVPPPDPLRVLVRRSSLELDPVVVERTWAVGRPTVHVTGHLRDRHRLRALAAGGVGDGYLARGGRTVFGKYTATGAWADSRRPGASPRWGSERRSWFSRSTTRTSSSFPLSTPARRAF